MQKYSCSLLVLLLTLAGVRQASASVLQELQADQLTRQIQTQALRGAPTAECQPGYSELNCEKQTDIWLDAVENLYDQGWEKEAREAAFGLDWPKLSFVQQVLVLRLFSTLSPESGVLNEIRRDLTSTRNSRTLSKIEQHVFCRFVDATGCGPAFSPERPLPSRQTVKDLYRQWLDLRLVVGGRYAQAPRVYLFCRADRSYPCRLLMKDKTGRAVRAANGRLWSQPILAYSRHRKNFDEPGGNTPAGVHLMNGVMPQANETELFGQFRRVVLNFVSPSANEGLQKKFLPVSSQKHDWWKEAVIARDMGRAFLRVHGVGRMNLDRENNFYGYYGTSGCIENRENTYDGVKYIDQRNFLDALMRAMELSPVFANETAIRGVLYLVTLDDEKRAVGPADLEFLDQP